MTIHFKSRSPFFNSAFSALNTERVVIFQIRYIHHLAFYRDRLQHSTLSARMSSPFLMDAPISRLEELFNRVGYPVDIRTRLYNANYDYDQPSLHLYSLLCPADLRFLRQVSKRAKLWAEQDMRKIFDIIVVDERLKQLSRSEAIMDLCSIAPYCRQIVFRFDEADICTNPLCTVFADINLDSTNEESFTQSTNPSFTQDAETWTR